MRRSALLGAMAVLCALSAMSATIAWSAPDGVAAAPRTTVKPTPGIRIEAEIVGQPRLGDVVTVVLTVRTTVPLTGVEIAITDTPGAMLIQGPGATALTTLDPASPAIVRVSLLLPTAGRVRVPVFVTGMSPYGGVARSVVVPIDVPGATPGHQPAPGGIHSMKAIETVR